MLNHELVRPAPPPPPHICFYPRQMKRFLHAEVLSSRKKISEWNFTYLYHSKIFSLQTELTSDKSFFEETNFNNNQLGTVMIAVLKDIPAEIRLNLFLIVSCIFSGHA